MSHRWKLKTSSCNVLLVLVIPILVKAEWAKGTNDSWEITNGVEGTSDQTRIYVGNDEIAEYFFHPSINDNSLILEDINKCLDSFQLITCVKMLLLCRINDAVNLLEEPGVAEKDVHFLNGFLVFKIKNQTDELSVSEKKDLSLDEEIAVKVKRILRRRSLVVNLLTKVKLEVEPVSQKVGDDSMCFSFTFRKEPESGSSHKENPNEGKKKKGGGMSMMMVVPPLIMLGLMPFTLASLKAMVMNAVMINMMALNGAIFMTIRNLVFGPRQGDNVKYVNYGYSKNRQTQSPKPVLIIHSPAAFVKQPPVHRKKNSGHPSSYHASQNYYHNENRYSNAGASHLYQGQNADNVEDYGNSYYVIHEDESKFNQFNRPRRAIQKKQSQSASGFNGINSSN